MLKVLTAALYLFSFNLYAVVPVNKSINAFIESRVSEFSQISEERKTQLKEIATGVKTELTKNNNAKLTFICTHNSRRSHLAQIWAQTAAAFYKLDKVTTFSGGTEATAFNPRAVKAIKDTGFIVSASETDSNPIYQVKWSEQAKPMQAFSKKYSSQENPQKDFIAVMVCSSADKGCPLVKGASQRFAIPYIDPKVSDGSPEEVKTYAERNQQIAREMIYLFKQVAVK